MSMKMVCNRCNKVKEDGETFDHIDYRSDIPTLKGYDLCPECSKLFRIFLDGGEVEEDRYKDSKPCSVVIHKLANGHYGIENDLKKSDMDKEESDLSVTMTKSSSGVYMPDGKPWTTGKKMPKVCKTCRYQNNSGNEEPCCHCNVIDPGEWDSRWKPVEEETNEQSSET